MKDTQKYILRKKHSRKNKTKYNGGSIKDDTIFTRISKYSIIFY